MRNAFVLSLFVLLFPVAIIETVQSQQAAKGWRGLVPLRATRRDVERVLGKPAQGIGYFETSDARIWVEYSVGPCEKGWPYGWNVKPNTVESFIVKPKDSVFLTELKLDYKKYVKTPTGHVSDHFHYINKDEGVAILVDEWTGKVMSFSYISTTADDKLACPGSLNRLPAGRRQADSLFRFDVYGDLSPSAENERLDKVAAALNGMPDTEATIIAYAGKVTHVNEAAARATCARDYLIKVHRINPDRIKAIDGGYRESLDVEVYIEPKDGDVPLARPEVRPSKVRINRAKVALICKSSHPQD